jgi:hypothetical protein
LRHLVGVDVLEEICEATPDFELADVVLGTAEGEGEAEQHRHIINS